MQFTALLVAVDAGQEQVLTWPVTARDVVRRTADWVVVSSALAGTCTVLVPTGAKSRASASTVHVMARPPGR
jgi:hypothetical protein